MNRELLIRLAHYLYAEVNLMYDFVGDIFDNDPLLLSVGQAFNRLYHKTANQADIDLLKSVDCANPNYFQHGEACGDCMASGLRFGESVNDLMGTLLLKVLHEKDYNLQKIKNIIEIKRHASPEDLILLNDKLIKKVKKYYPDNTLEALCVKVIAKNKSKLGAKQLSAAISSTLFVKYPEMEVDADRLVETQLSKFLLKYRPESLESRVLFRLMQVSLCSKGLHDAVHRLLTETNYKDYNAYLRKHLSLPIINAMRVCRNQPEKFTDELRSILKKYEPQAVETIYLKYLKAFEKRDACAEDLQKLLSNKNLNGKMTDHLLNTLHAPLSAIIEAYKNLSPRL